MLDTPNFRPNRSPGGKRQGHSTWQLDTGGMNGADSPSDGSGELTHRRDGVGTRSMMASMYRGERRVPPPRIGRQQLRWRESGDTCARLCSSRKPLDWRNLHSVRRERRLLYLAVWPRLAQQVKVPVRRVVGGHRPTDRCGNLQRFVSRALEKASPALRFRHNSPTTCGPLAG